MLGVTHVGLRKPQWRCSPVFEAFFVRNFDTPGYNCTSGCDTAARAALKGLALADWPSWYHNFFSEALSTDDENDGGFYFL